MQSLPLAAFYSWCAYLSAAATLLTFITGVLFFTVGEPFGVMNDISSVFQVLLMVPLTVAVVQLSPVGYRAPAIAAAVVGIGGMLVTAVGQTLLVLRRIDFQTSLRFTPGGAAIGMWLIAVSLLALAGGYLPQGLVWIGIAAGVGYVATVVGFLMGGQKHPLFYAGGVVMAIGYPIWAIWLGRFLSAV
jgi:hypothetical protein